MTGLLMTMLLAGLPSSQQRARASEFLATLGFEDDVDVVVSPNREFMLVAEESEDGADARLRILDLDPVTGEYLAILEEYDEAEGILGFEDGVDPLVIAQPGAIGDYLILIPVENEDGTEAKVIQILTTAAGVELDRNVIDLEDLGFREDVDPIWATYSVGGSAAVAFLALESEDRAVRGVLAIDVDNGDGDWGACFLISTDERLGPCGTYNEVVDWLPGLADGVDMLAYSAVSGFVTLWLPVVADDGSGDLLVLTFSSDVLPGNVPPEFLPPYVSVKDENAGGTRPASFPGYERDVDLILLGPGQCGETHSVLVPVEGPDDDADLYRVDDLGQVDWMFSLDSGDPTLLFPGYEAGVDLLVRCDLIPPRVMVPVENADGTDADLYVVDLEFGTLLATAEAVNTGIVLPGWEIGVDLVQWTDDVLVAPLEGVGDPALVTFDFDAVILDVVFGPFLMGFQRSVDPIVVPYEPDPVLIVPYGLDDGSDADIYAHFFPPFVVGGVSLESIHTALELSQFEWDVDLGVVDNLQPGSQHLCVPEEAPGGAGARLRFEPISLSYPNPLLVVATEASGDLPATLYLVDVNSGNLVLVADDLLGLESGLDMANGMGPVTPGDVPEFERPTGVDRDGDPTLAWVVGSTSVSPLEAGGGAPTNPLGVTHRNPFVPPEQIRYILQAPGEVQLTVIDVAGRVVRNLFAGEQPAGMHTIEWDGRDYRGLHAPAGIYFVELSGGGATTASKLVLVR